jgi:hypothetical protein
VFGTPAPVVQLEFPELLEEVLVGIVITGKGAIVGRGAKVGKGVGIVNVVLL